MAAMLGMFLQSRWKLALVLELSFGCLDSFLNIGSSLLVCSVAVEACHLSCISRFDRAAGQFSIAAVLGKIAPSQFAVFLRGAGVAGSSSQAARHGSSAHVLRGHGLASQYTYLIQSCLNTASLLVLSHLLLLLHQCLDVAEHHLGTCKSLNQSWGRNT